MGNKRPPHIYKALQAFIKSRNISIDADLGVVILTREVLSQDFMPICLPRANTKLLSKDNYIIGWGYEYDYEPQAKCNSKIFPKTFLSLSPIFSKLKTLFRDNYHDCSLNFSTVCMYNKPNWSWSLWKMYPKMWTTDRPTKHPLQVRTELH